MAKTESPLLSLGARGTIGDALTYQKRGTGTIVREKPIPRDPYSLNQAYQRWDYRDYAHLWTLLSNSEKQIYRTKASRYHITGFSQWMRENLKDLPNILGRWRLDEKAGATAYDSSPYGRNGIITGATPITGVIAGGYSFDGINDFINLGALINLGILDFAIEFWIKTTTDFVIIASKFQNAGNRWRIEVGMFVAGKLGFYCSAGGVASVFALDAATNIVDGLWHHIVILGDRGNRGWIYLDGQDDTDTRTTILANDADNTGPLHLARRIAAYDPLDLDNLIIYDRLEDETEIKRHSERRYP